MAELNAATNNVLVKTYTWGPDISGSFGGAGGNGGVLVFKDHTSTLNESFYPAYDAQGNVTGLIDTSGNLDAAYEYDPFGKLIRYSGTSRASMSLLYGTKYTDMETGLIYYGHRYYDPRQGRFINRDPIGEAGGINLYGFVGNSPTNRVDFLGLCNSEGDVDPKTGDEICSDDPLDGLIIIGRTDDGNFIVTGSPEDIARLNQLASNYVGEDGQGGLIWDGQFSDGSQLGWDGDSFVVMDQNSRVINEFGIGETVLVAGNSDTGFDPIYAEVKIGDIEVIGYEDTRTPISEGNTYFFGFGINAAMVLGFDANIDVGMYFGGGLSNWRNWDIGLIYTLASQGGINAGKDIHIGGIRGSLQDQEGPYLFAMGSGVIIGTPFGITGEIIDNQQSSIDHYRDENPANNPLLSMDPNGWFFGISTGLPVGVGAGFGNAGVVSLQGVTHTFWNWFDSEEEEED